MDKTDLGEPPPPSEASQALGQRLDTLEATVRDLAVSQEHLRHQLAEVVHLLGRLADASDDGDGVRLSPDALEYFPPPRRRPVWSRCKRLLRLAVRAVRGRLS